MYERFDRFNKKFSPVGESKLRDVFLKTDNFISGRFFAEILRDVFEGLGESGCCAELRPSVYGREASEGGGGKLAEWVQSQNLHSDNLRWLFQVGNKHSNDSYIFIDNFTVFSRSPCLSASIRKPVRCIPSRTSWKMSFAPRSR